jgi:hypothetical protein
MDQITSVHIAGWLACAAFLVGLAIGCLSLIDRLKPKPTTQEVADQAAAKFASRDAASELAARIAAMEQLRTKDLSDASFSRKNIYDAMGEMERRINESLVGMRAGMGEMERRINSADEIRTDKLRDLITNLFADLGEIRGEAHAKKGDS